MKKRILKISAVIGIILFVFCTAAGSVNSAADTSAFGNLPVRSAGKPGDGALYSPHLAARPKGAPHPEWLQAAFAVSATARAKETGAASFSEMLDEIYAPSYAYSEQEKAFIARVVYAEARGEIFEGKVAVAAVVLNRFESGRFGKTVKRVVFARNQFAVSRRYTAECMKAVEIAIDNKDAYPDDMYYFRVSKSKKWRNFDYFTRIGNHSFYCA